MTPESDADLTTYLSELLRTNKPEQQNLTFWFSTPENPYKPEDHTPIKTRILRDLLELKGEKLTHKTTQNPHKKLLDAFIGPIRC